MCLWHLFQRGWTKAGLSGSMHPREDRAVRPAAGVPVLRRGHRVEAYGCDRYML
jgi:hypothetical protein